MRQPAWVFVIALRVTCVHSGKWLAIGDLMVEIDILFATFIIFSLFL